MKAGQLIYRASALLAIATLVSCAAPVTRKAQTAPPISPASQLPSPESSPAGPTQVAPSAAPPPVTSMPQAMPFNKEVALREWMEQQNRLYRIAAPLLFKNVDICRDRVRNVLGLTAKNKFSYGDEFIDAASMQGLDDRLRVVSVLSGSGAERAGVERGDVLLVAGIEPLPAGRDAEPKAIALIGAELQGRDNVHLTLSREDERLTTDASLTPACAFSVELGDTSDSGSYSDGHRILVTRGMTDSAQSDAELAYVIAKEMARSLLATEPNSSSAKIIDVLHALHSEPASAIQPSSYVTTAQNLSAEWQVLAIDLLQRAGYATQDAAEFWQRTQ